ncbi:MAG: hypothetical protein ACAI44_38160, partial [Candidatus Sericytochromatia bacterium]
MQPAECPVGAANPVRGRAGSAACKPVRIPVGFGVRACRRYPDRDEYQYLGREFQSRRKSSEPFAERCFAQPNTDPDTYADTYANTYANT